MNQPIRQILASLLVFSCFALTACGDDDDPPDLGPPSVATYTIGGTVSGLTGTGLVLRLNGSTNATINANGAFTFGGGFSSGTAYSVAVLTQPSSPAQSCSINPAAGTVAGAIVTSINVICGVGGRFAYVTNNGLNTINSVSGYTINQLNGMMTPIAGTPIAAGHTPLALAANPAGTFLYAGNFSNIGPVPGSFSVYAINSSTGALSAITGSPFATASSVYDIAIVPSGNFMVTANAGTPGVSVYSLNGTTGVPTFVATTPIGSTTVSVAVDPTGSFVYVGVVGGTPGTNAGTIRAYSLNATTGALTALAGSPYTTVNGFILDVSVHPSGGFLYAAHSSGILAYTLNSTTGAITPVVGSPFATPIAGNALGLDPLGSFLYVAHDSSGSDSKVSGYSVNATTGALTLTGAPVPSVDRPTRVVVDPSGSYAYVSNTASNVITVYAINRTSGVLVNTGSPIPNGTDTNPVTIVIVR